MSGQSIQARVVAIAGELPESQRRVADLLVRDPEAIAFGTSASVAAATDTSTPTVIRFAGKLGFDGFTALRDAVRGEVSQQLRSTVERMRHQPRGDLLERALTVEVANVERTLRGVDPDDFDRAIGLLADPDRRVWVLPASQTLGASQHFADDLTLCRGRVLCLTDAEFRSMTALSRLRPGDVLVSIDIQRHEGWLVRVQRGAVARGAVPLALIDRLPCSLDLSGGVPLTFTCDTTSPFDSQVGLVALCNLLVSGVAERLRASIEPRAEVLEATWVDHHLFDP